LAADFRAIFSVSLWDVRGQELLTLISDLLTDPSSRFHAAVAEWKHPLSRDAMYSLDLMDILLMRWTGDKFKPVSRPWSDIRSGGVKRTAAEALAILRPQKSI
jgi:hypothetical protein